MTPSGYTKIDQDLNEGAGGTFNYLCISKSGKNTMTKITFVALNTKCSVATRDGYYVFKQDLNTGTDKTGAYVYLLYRTDTGKPLWMRIDFTNWPSVQCLFSNVSEDVWLCYPFLCL